jgi:hypothetical protein
VLRYATTGEGMAVRGSSPAGQGGIAQTAERRVHNPEVRWCNSSSRNQAEQGARPCRPGKCRAALSSNAEARAISRFAPGTRGGEGHRSAFLMYGPARRWRAALLDHRHHPVHEAKPTTYPFTGCIVSPARRLASEARGRGFKSHHPDQFASPSSLNHGEDGVVAAFAVVTREERFDPAPHPRSHSWMAEVAQAADCKSAHAGSTPAPASIPRERSTSLPIQGR